ncbi:hypothetical protein GHT06_010735 [Daphnia sinensis]|uniref:Cytochrome P450 n=1 Tax=Daphnia sinensis TaxID=1820382 RepID=A0AAD5KZF1_9CRUS|nr:hypothetical protein GHT06_010735 [Daphnia sinensis]
MSSALNNVNSLRTDVILSIWLILPAIAIFYYWKWSRSRTVRLINAIPGRKPLPLLGNLLHWDVFSEDFYRDMATSWTKKYGPIARVWFGPRPFVAIASPELAQKFLSTTKHYTMANDFSLLGDWLGNSLFLSTGAHWKNRRRLVTPVFHIQNFDSFIDIFNEESSICAAEFEKMIETNPDKEINVTRVMTQCALNIICESAMGQTKLEKEKQVYISNVQRYCQIFIRRVQRPWLSINWIYRMTSLRREYERCLSVMHAFTNKVARERREMFEQSVKKNSDQLPNDVIVDEKPKSTSRFAMVDRLIEASYEGADLDDTGIREEINMLTFAGHDTTSIAMGWFLYLIAKHPTHQQMIVDELDSVFRGDRDRPCTLQDVSELQYMERCIKETLRLYPSVPVLVRKVSQDIEIGGYTIPAGVTVIPFFYYIHHDPDLYPDPEAFKPERFFPENSIDRHPYAFIPFGAGPRHCLECHVRPLVLNPIEVFTSALQKLSVTEEFFN